MLIESELTVTRYRILGVSFSMESTDGTAFPLRHATIAAFDVVPPSLRAMTLQQASHWMWGYHHRLQERLAISKAKNCVSAPKRVNRSLITTLYFSIFTPNVKVLIVQTKRVVNE